MVGGKNFQLDGSHDDTLGLSQVAVQQRNLLTGTEC